MRNSGSQDKKDSPRLPLFCYPCQRGDLNFLSGLPAIQKDLLPDS